MSKKSLKYLLDEMRRWERDMANADPKAKAYWEDAFRFFRARIRVAKLIEKEEKEEVGG